jgi:hypothetical protein
VCFHNYGNVVEDRGKKIHKKLWKDKEVEVVVEGTNLSSSMPIENPKEHGGLEVKSMSESQDPNFLQGHSFTLKDLIVGDRSISLNFGSQQLEVQNDTIANIYGNLEFTILQSNKLETI